MNDKLKDILIDIKSVYDFGQMHKKDYLDEDGSINKDGLSQLRRIRAKPFNWNDRKIDGYEAYHLSERTKTAWAGKWSDYYKMHEFLNTMRNRFIEEFFYNKCPKCNGWGSDFSEPPPRGKCKKCKGVGKVRKTNAELKEVKLK